VIRLCTNPYLPIEEYVLSDQPGAFFLECLAVDVALFHVDHSVTVRNVMTGAHQGLEGDCSEFKKCEHIS
jgi:hypothetical protein